MTSVDGEKKNKSDLFGCFQRKFDELFFDQIVRTEKINRTIFTAEGHVTIGDGDRCDLNDKRNEKKKNEKTKRKQKPFYFRIRMFFTVKRNDFGNWIKFFINKSLKKQRDETFFDLSRRTLFVLINRIVCFRLISSN